MSAPAPPQRVRDWLLGQEALLRLLGSARSEDRLAHAYLFVGPRGCGKTRTALAFAQELLCQAPEGVSDAGAPSRSGARAGGKAPCGTCHGCVQVARLLHPDLHLVFPATREEAEDMSGRATLLERYAANRYHLLEHSPSASIGIDRIRALKEEVAKSGLEGDRRVVIISGAGRMTEQAAQSALKLIEEPPPDTVLILESESLAQLLPTLVSRCQRLRLRTLPVSELIAVLEKELGQEPAQARLLAAL